MALERVRRAIRKAVPAVKEGISYQIPVYTLNGVPVLFVAGWKAHYSIYPASDALVAAFKTDLAPYERSKGTIRFPNERPLPVAVIKRLVKARLRELDGPTKRARTARA